MGIFTGLTEVFEDSTAYGCLFHFKQAIRAKAGKLGLVKLEHENQNFQLFLKMVGAMEYLPAAKIQEFWLRGIQSYCKYAWLISFCQQ